ncbi:MAG: hypothetical protein LBL72_06850 [Candidatus Accumulibacter sp.]|jgi:hypothetical protein|nr:hypothetical protein [Accumulibacter sp.]
MKTTACSICGRVMKTVQTPNASICEDCVDTMKDVFLAENGHVNEADIKDPGAKSSPIAATITRCRFGQPLVILTGHPFNDLEIRPNELRKMGQRLIALAETAVRIPHGGKHTHPTRVLIGDEEKNHEH